MMRILIHAVIFFLLIKVNNKLCFLFEGNDHNTTSISNNTSDANEIENTDDQRHNNTEFESLCRQITESAINDGKNFKFYY